MEKPTKHQRPQGSHYLAQRILLPSWTMSRVLPQIIEWKSLKILGRENLRQCPSCQGNGGAQGCFTHLLSQQGPCRAMVAALTLGMNLSKNSEYIFVSLLSLLHSAVSFGKQGIQGKDSVRAAEEGRAPCFMEPHWSQGSHVSRVSRL